MAGVQVPQYYEVGAPLTLDQLLAKPVETKFVGPNCQISTVGELKKVQAMQKKVIAPLKPTMGGTGKASYAAGVSRAREASQLAALVSGDAQSSRSAAPGKVGMLRPVPGIGLVNGKATGFVVTPGAFLTIAGFEFGDTKGQANLVGNFPPGGAAALTIVDWKPGSVYALLPAGLRGALDQPVTVQLITAVQKTYRKDGGRFVATREDTTVTTDIPRLLKFEYGPTWGAFLDPSGQVVRQEQGESLTCKPPGTDTFTIIDPGKGFVVTGLNAAWGPTDSGDGSSTGQQGSRTYTPGYGFGEWNGNRIPFHWGVWRSHQSEFGLPGGPGYSPASDVCQSIYAISVGLNGPAGVAPF
jgi:hypothetical protein